jgi:hypothetical protein
MCHHYTPNSANVKPLEAESFMKTLIRDEVRVLVYRTFVEAKAKIGKFIGLIYN